jgi:hypothetical protein
LILIKPTCFWVETYETAQNSAFFYLAAKYKIIPIPFLKKVLNDTEEELLIESFIQLMISSMELLKYSANVKVIEPQSLMGYNKDRLLKSTGTCS